MRSCSRRAVCKSSVYWRRDGRGWREVAGAGGRGRMSCSKTTRRLWPAAAEKRQSRDRRPPVSAAGAQPTTDKTTGMRARERRRRARRRRAAGHYSSPSMAGHPPSSQSIARRGRIIPRKKRPWPPTDKRLATDQSLSVVVPETL